MEVLVSRVRIARRPPGVPGSSRAGSSGAAAVRYRHSTAATTISTAGREVHDQAPLQAHQRGLQVGLNGDLLVGLADGLDDRLGLRGGDADRGQPLAGNRQKIMGSPAIPG